MSKFLDELEAGIKRMHVLADDGLKAVEKLADFAGKLAPVAAQVAPMCGPAAAEVAAGAAVTEALAPLVSGGVKAVEGALEQQAA